MLHFRKTMKLPQMVWVWKLSPILFIPLFHKATKMKCQTLGGSYTQNLNFDSLLGWITNEDHVQKCYMTRVWKGWVYSAWNNVDASILVQVLMCLDGVTEVIVFDWYTDCIGWMETNQRSLTLPSFKNYSSTDVAFLMHLESWSGHLFTVLTSSV